MALERPMGDLLFPPFGFSGVATVEDLGLPTGVGTVDVGGEEDGCFRSVLPLPTPGAGETG